MSENTPSTQKVAVLPDSIKLQQTLAVVNDLDVNVVFIERNIKDLQRELREIKLRLKRTRLMLEAK